jgi:hypothetical protein
MKTPCSNCNQRLEIPEELAGQTIECPACKASLIVPAIEAPPPATPQVQATTPQAASSKKSKSPPKASKSKKYKSRIPIIAAIGIACILIMGLVTYSFSWSSQNYSLTMSGETLYLEVNSDGSFMLATPDGDHVFGDWETGGKTGGLIVCKGKARRSSAKIDIAYNKDTLKLISMSMDGTKMPSRILDKIYLKKTDVKIDPRESIKPAKRGVQGRVKETQVNDSESLSQIDRDLLMAAFRGRTMELWRALKAGANINVKDSKRELWGPAGHSPITIASLMERVETIKFLIDKGANVNAKWVEKTPIDIIENWEISDKEELIKLLRKKGGKTGEELKAEQN